MKSRLARRPFLTALASMSASLLISPLNAHAQANDYPSRAVSIIVPYTPGGSNDLVGRLLGAKLSELWGQPVIVDNRPGAGGNLGANAVAKSKPDGYTLLITPNNLFTMNPFMMGPGEVGYDPIKDFAPVSLVATGPILFAARSDFPANTVPELIAYAKANPNALTYASAGIGTPHHLTAELLKSMAGINMLHVPYRGAVPAVTDLAGGRVDVMFGIPNSLVPFIERGEIKPLAVSSPERAESLPNVPTIAEEGLQGFNSTLWIGLTAPAATPQDVIDKINASVRTAMSDPAIIEALEGQGLKADAGPQDEFVQMIKEDSARWSNLIKSQNLAANP